MATRYTRTVSNSRYLFADAGYSHNMEAASPGNIIMWRQYKEWLGHSDCSKRDDVNNHFWRFFCFTWTGKTKYMELQCSKLATPCTKECHDYAQCIKKKYQSKTFPQLFQNSLCCSDSFTKQCYSCSSFLNTTHCQCNSQKISLRP